MIGALVLALTICLLPQQAERLRESSLPPFLRAYLAAVCTARVQRACVETAMSWVQHQREKGNSFRLNWVSQNSCPPRTRNVVFVWKWVFLQMK
jgi:hypothetical protein